MHRYLTLEQCGRWPQRAGASRGDLLILVADRASAGQPGAGRACGASWRAA